MIPHVSENVSVAFLNMKMKCAISIKWALIYLRGMQNTEVALCSPADVFLRCLLNSDLI